jgi:alpha-L-glutamate ligase-like protein
VKWARPGALARAGVLGMNRRNRIFIGPHNPRTAYPLVDDKLRTKRMLEECGVPTPELLHVVRSQHEVRDPGRFLPAEGFCIKPAKGSGGKGILVVVRREGDRFVKGSGVQLETGDLRRHLSNVLAGLFSLGGNPDAAIVEALIRPEPAMAELSHEGVPDIRILVFRGYPVMAMMRLATRASDGKANLHQGAIGVGIDIAGGESLHALQHGRPVTRHPDTGLALDAIRIPGWQDMLEVAARCHDITGLGYLGVDMVVDAVHGAQVLELNARPGLAIQMANGAGLLPRLRAIAAHADGCSENPGERVDHVQAVFDRGPPHG